MSVVLSESMRSSCLLLLCAVTHVHVGSSSVLTSGSGFLCLSGVRGERVKMCHRELLNRGKAIFRQRAAGISPHSGAEALKEYVGCSCNLTSGMFCETDSQDIKDQRHAVGLHPALYQEFI